MKLIKLLIIKNQSEKESLLTKVFDGFQFLAVNPTYSCLSKVRNSLTKERFDVVVSCLHISAKQELTIAEDLSAELKCPLIVLTHHNEMNHSQKLIQAGAQDCLLEENLCATRFEAVILNSLERFKAKLDANQQLGNMKEKLKSITETSFGTLIFIKNNKIKNVNHEFSRIFGYDSAEVIGTSVEHIVESSSHPILVKALSQPEGEHELTCIKKCGNLFSAKVRSNVYGEVEQPMHVLALKDVTFEKNEARLHYGANHDSLTSLKNRQAFLEQLREAATVYEQDDSRTYAVLFIDLDGFKPINDHYGHDVGDKVLAAVAKRLLASTKKTDVAARHGGDEFLVLLKQLKSSESAVKVAERILRVLKTPYLVEEHTLQLTSSIGLALGHDSKGKPDGLLRNADMAMYQAKRTGKNRLAVFSQAMQKEAREQTSLERRFRAAVKNGELNLHFQPIVHLKNLQVQGFEALLRWLQPDESFMNPEQVVRMAEAANLMKTIGKQTIRQACEGLKQWHLLNTQLSLSINISNKQLLDPDFSNFVTGAVSKAGLRPEQLCLEVKETFFTSEASPAAQTLSRLKQAGFRLYIDDFGQGYSSLMCIQKLGVSALKIDTKLVQAIGDLRVNEMVRAIIKLAKSLCMSTIAEGVETKNQLDYLRHLGCDFAQGFYFSEAVCPKQAPDLLMKPSWLPNEPSKQALALISS